MCCKVFEVHQRSDVRVVINEAMCALSSGRSTQILMEPASRSMAILMPRVPGVTLLQYLDDCIDQEEEGGRGKILVALKRCAVELEKCHAHDVIHGDVSMLNFLVDEGTSGLACTLIDFGLSTCANSRGQGYETTVFMISISIR